METTGGRGVVLLSRDMVLVSRDIALVSRGVAIGGWSMVTQPDPITLAMVGG